jgi:hypothetical protein
MWPYLDLKLRSSLKFLVQAHVLPTPIGTTVITAIRTNMVGYRKNESEWQLTT